MLLLLLLAVLSHSTAVVVSSGSAETAAGDVCRGCAAVADSADDRPDGAPTSDGTGTMSVQLVLCVADSVWRAAGHLARVCCMHAHGALAHRACSDAAVAAGCALIPLPSESDPALPRPQLVMAWLCCCGRFGGRSA